MRIVFAELQRSITIPGLGRDEGSSFMEVLDWETADKHRAAGLPWRFPVSMNLEAGWLHFTFTVRTGEVTTTHKRSVPATMIKYVDPAEETATAETQPKRGRSAQPQA